MPKIGDVTVKSLKRPTALGVHIFAGGFTVRTVDLRKLPKSSTDITERYS